MSEETATTEGDPPQQSPAPNIVAIPRLGNVQMILFTKGEGIQQRIAAKIVKIPKPGQPNENVWEMEDLAALATLAKKATVFAMEAQTARPLMAPPSEDA